MNDKLQEYLIVLPRPPLATDYQTQAINELYGGDREAWAMDGGRLMYHHAAKKAGEGGFMLSGTTPKGPVVIAEPGRLDELKKFIPAWCRAMEINRE